MTPPVKPPTSGAGVFACVLIAFAVLLIRLPFLDQAIQGDDIYYLAGAQHAQIEPLHPNHAQYVFLGDKVDMRGHPHPPLNVWILGALLAVFGDIKEVPFHAAYIAFSLIAAFSMWALARHFSPHPLLATLLFCAVPAFVVNGTSLEADLPLLAFWMLGLALFVLDRNSVATALALSLAALAGYQALLLTPILGVYVWLHHRRSLRRWALAFTPLIAIAVWQLFEAASTGALPASVLGGYLSSYGFQALANKIRNAQALGVHACFMIFPPLVFAALWKERHKRDADTLFLSSWILIFFAGALAMFFAGSARYLLPMAAPLALLASRLPAPWVALGFGLQLILSFALASVNYQHWNGYRQFAASMARQAAGRRVWINGEWGLRYYFEALGGLPLERGQSVRPGDMVVTSQLAYPVAYTTGGGSPVPIGGFAITPSLPLRIIGLGTRSAYSTYVNGLLPFDYSREPVDRVSAEVIVRRQPTLEYVRMNDPEAPRHIVSGVYELEDNKFRWMSSQAVLVLKGPAGPKTLRVALYVPGQSLSKPVRVSVDGKGVMSATFDSAGPFRLESKPFQPGGATATITIEISETFSAPGDRRRLGVILTEVGFVDLTESKGTP